MAMPDARGVEETRKLANCIPCRTRKIKCDRAFPCTSCLRNGIECIANPYKSVPRGRRGGRKHLDGSYKTRIARLEGLLQDLQERIPFPQPSADAAQVCGEVNVNREKREIPQSQWQDSRGLVSISPAIRSTPATSATLTPASVESLGGSFWVSLNDEIVGLREVFGDVSDDEGEDAEPSQKVVSSPTSQDSLWYFPLPQSNALNAETRVSSEVPQAYASILCSAYLDKIDPVFKVVHRPSLSQYLEGRGPYLDRLPGDRAVQALTFAVFYAAVTGQTDAECWQKLGQSRESLLDQYRKDLTHALALADCVNTTDITTLQALVLFLLCVRTNDNSRLTWTLIGLAVRIAHALGLHRDVTNRFLPPFEREMRRRLWWQLSILDTQASNDRASDPVILAGTFDTPLPMNIDDEDIKFGDTAAVLPRQGFTTMTFNLITFELSATLREVMYVYPATKARSAAELDLDRDQKLALIDTAQKRIEQHYLDPSQQSTSFFLFTRKIIDVCVGVMWLVACRPLRSRPHPSKRSVAEQMRVLDKSVGVLELAFELNDFARTKWFAATYVQWHALAVTLAELCVLRDGPAARRAWKAVDAIFERSADRIADSVSGRLWRPIRKLMAKAQRNRSSTIVGPTDLHGLNVAPEPALHTAQMNGDQDARNGLLDPRGSFSNLPNQGPSVPLAGQSWDMNAVEAQLGPFEDDPMQWVDWETFVEDFQWQASQVSPQ